MKFAPLHHVVGALFLMVGGTVGCAGDFHARPVRSPSALTATEPRADGTPLTAPSVEWCLRTLESGSENGAERPPSSPGFAGQEPQATRRRATARLVELYAAALLSAPGHELRVSPSLSSLSTGAGELRRPFRLRLRRGRGPGGVEPSRFAALEPVERYRVTGVERFSRTPGEGAPLVGSLRPVLPINRPGPVPAKPVVGLTWAVTAVPVVGRAAGDGTAAATVVTLDLYDPHLTGPATARPGGTTSPLAADYTTPIAVAVTRFQPQRRGWMGFMRGGEYFPSAGLFALEKPTTEKTPLVFVHGLVSDPGDFHVLLNDLAGDAAVRRRHQVWFFYYPSSLPVPYSAMMLREDLEAYVRQLDPAGTHPALHRAVLVGHSMGGLLCRLAISDGGGPYYRHFFLSPVDELKLSASDRRLVRRGFFYRASPDVGQVVFVATPHRGSQLAGGALGNLGRLLVHLPAAALTPIRAILRDNRAALAAGNSLQAASSISSLSPRDPVVRALADLPMRPGVRLHSILGDRGRGGPPERSSDGVVPYNSSHLPQAESELLVPAGHTGTLKRPETAAEIARVLDPSPAPPSTGERGGSHRRPNLRSDRNHFGKTKTPRAARG